MTFFRYKSVRRLHGTTLVFVGMSFVMSPELRAEEAPEEESQSSEESTETQAADVPIKTHPKSGGLDVAIDPNAKIKNIGDLHGFRVGACVGLDLSCLFFGVKVGYSTDRIGFLVQLPWVDVEAISYFGSFESGGSAYRRPFASADFNLLMVDFDLFGVFGIGVGIEVQVIQGSSFVIRPKVGLDGVGQPFHPDDPIPWYPTASLSILWAP
jgi:hypothetical protein